jgi:exonuclease SbcD
MRILHTSDWHLGQHFIGKSRANEHQSFITWLLSQITLHKIDALIIAGDIFDTGSPPSYAREIYNQFVISMKEINCQLVVLGGNHDSVSMLNESKDILTYLSATVIANAKEEAGDQVIVLNDSEGQPGAVLCAIPYLRPRDIMLSQANESGDQKQQALGTAIAEHYQHIFELAQAKRSSLKLDLPIVATGHLTAMGVTASTSVRDIYVGSLEAFPASSFPDADYIALGHIHRPQIVGKQPHIRYCGSPIPLSFDELGTQKQVLMVEFSKGKSAEITPLEIPRFQSMQFIKGDLEEIEKQIIAINQSSTKQTTWLSIEIETQEYLNNLTQRIQDISEGLNVEILQLRRARPQGQTHIKQQQQETLAELTPEDVFERRLALEDFSGETGVSVERIREQFKRIVSEIHDTDETANVNLHPSKGDAL